MVETFVGDSTHFISYPSGESFPLYLPAPSYIAPSMLLHHKYHFLKQQSLHIHMTQLSRMASYTAHKSVVR